MERELSTSLCDIKYKIVFLGDSGVGKTSIIERFVKNHYEVNGRPTIGIDFLTRNITLEDKTYKLQLWDTAGQQKYKSLVPAYLRDANCACFVFDLSRKETFDNIKTWLQLYRQHSTGECIAMLMANKCDLVNLNQCVYKQEIQDFSIRQNLILAQTSAKQGKQVRQSFVKLIKQIKKSENEKQNGERLDERTQAHNFFLKYNQLRFGHEKKRSQCCYI